MAFPVDGMTLRTVFFAVFIGLLAAFLYRDREKMKRHTIIFFRRTERGIETIDRIAKRFPRFWRFYANSGAFVSGISIVGSLGLILYAVYTMIKTKSAASGPSLILPGLVAENQFQAGVSFIPIEYWVIGIGILMVSHELSHGIVARLEEFEINSVGWGVMAVIPFAFVEPKGEQMLPGADGEESSGHWNQGSWKSQVRVLCAGSFANYLVGAFFLLLAFGMVGFPGSTGLVTESSGVIYNAQEDFPAEKAGMNNGTLKQVNGKDIESIEDLRSAMDGLDPGDSVRVVSSEGNFSVTATNKTGREGGYIGILMGESNVIKEEYEDYQAGLNWFSNLLYTVAFLNIMIGLFNMLPAKPLDGGWVVENLLERFLGEKYIPYLNGFSLTVWTVIIITLIVSLIGI